VKTQIKASFFFSSLDPSGSRSILRAVLPPSSSTAVYRRRGVPGLARVTHEEHGHRRRGNAAAVRGGGEGRAMRALSGERGRERGAVKVKLRD
jgi:hypothetical protein